MILRSLKGFAAQYLPHNREKYQLITSHVVRTPSGTSSPSSTTSSFDEDVNIRSRLPFHYLLHELQQWSFLLLPSFVQRRLRPSHFKPQRIYPTSYLDGLRGLASLIVFFCHYTEGNCGWFTAHPWGSWDEDDLVRRSSPLQLPFIRLIFSGRPMVHIFFFISGFVLSYKPLKLIRQRNFEVVHSTLASSVFRRAMRLFLPTTISTFLVMLLVYYGWGLDGLKQQTFLLQFKDWVRAIFWEITYSWDWDMQKWPKYDVHLWTIQIEFANSMLLFITVLGLSRCKTYVRLASVLGIMIYSMTAGHWAAFEFIGGIFVGEIGLIQKARSEGEYNKEAAGSVFSDDTKPSTLTCKAWQLFWLFNFICAAWISCWPNMFPERVPILGYLSDHTPEPYHERGFNQIQFFWFALSGLQVMFAVQNLPYLQRFFTTPPIQYLGNISYALYIVHGPMLDLLAGKTMPFAWTVVGHSDTGMWTRTVGWFVGLCFLGVPVMWVADLFWRAVDATSVEFAKWLEGVCLIKED